jgi:hypothetical protein
MKIIDLEDKEIEVVDLQLALIQAGDFRFLRIERFFQCCFQREAKGLLEVCLSKIVNDIA